MKKRSHDAQCVKKRFRSWCAFFAFMIPAALGTEFHVTPNGTPEGDGSTGNPWNLATALAHPETVKPGDTIWLHGGSYRGSFESRLMGEAGAPVIVRQVPGERARILLERSGNLAVGLNLKGEYARYQDFEVTCDNPIRETKTPGSWPEDMQRGSVEARGSHLQLINLIIHDLGSGSGFWREGEGGEIYGCLIYNNGWMAPDRSHGHGIYTQNERGIKTIADTLIFGQFGAGLHLYGSGNSSLRGYRLDGVVAFDNGRPGMTRDLLVGGGAPLDDIVIENCFTRGSGLQIGYAADVENLKVTARHNTLDGGLRIQYPGEYVLESNTVIATGSLFTIQLRKGQKPDRLVVDKNTYIKTEKQWNPFAIYAPEGNRIGDLGVLQTAGFDTNSTFATTLPESARVFVRPNRYEAGRGHVVIYNWNGADAVAADLGGILKKGQAFRIVHARDFFGEAVVEGTYNGSPVPIPMKPRKTASPIGLEANEEMTDRQFGVFVILPVASE